MELENNPKQIDICIEMGYDVEVDLSYDELTQSSGWVMINQVMSFHFLNWLSQGLMIFGFIVKTFTYIGFYD